MVLKLAECSIHHAREHTVLEVDDVDGEGEKSCRCDTEEDEASALGVEPIHNRVDKRQRLKEAVVGTIQDSRSKGLASHSEPNNCICELTPYRQ